MKQHLKQKYLAFTFFHLVTLKKFSDRCSGKNHSVILAATTIVNLIALNLFVPSTSQYAYCVCVCVTARHAPLVNKVCAERQLDVFPQPDTLNAVTLEENTASLAYWLNGIDSVPFPTYFPA